MAQPPALYSDLHLAPQLLPLLMLRTRQVAVMYEDTSRAFSAPSLVQYFEKSWAVSVGVLHTAFTTRW